MGPGRITGFALFALACQPPPPTADAGGCECPNDAGPLDAGAPDAGPDAGSPCCAQWYVAPDGGPGGAGTLSSPWDLATALAQPPQMKPGDTLWLRAGTYSGHFTSALTGAPGASISVRQYPGERATLADDRDTAGGATLQVNGAYADYWDFEVTNTAGNRGLHLCDSQHFRPMGLQIEGRNTRFIHLVVHDTGIAFGFWSDAPDSELYGNVIYNNGTLNDLADGGVGECIENGHGIYSSNDTGFKRITDNLVTNNSGFGIQLHNGPTTQIIGFDIEGNAVYQNGALSGDAVRLPNLYIGPDPGTATGQLTFAENFTYHSAGQAFVPSWTDADVCLACDPWSPHGTLLDVTYSNNYAAGGLATVAALAWTTSFTATGNTLVSREALIALAAPPPGATYSVDRNRYFALGPANAFAFNGAPVTDFSGWQSASTFDTHGISTSGAPSGADAVKVFVRPSAFEPGRGHVIINDWDLTPTVSVDPSTVLKAGDHYVVQNAQDFFGPPVATGLYDGGTIDLPMSGLSVAAPVAWPSPPPSGPEFNAFVILRR